MLQQFIAYICLYLVAKVRDDGLLFQLLEEFPHLHISHHTMNKMWRQQLAHTEQLKAASGRSRPKLQDEVSSLIHSFTLSAGIAPRQDSQQFIVHTKRILTLSMQRR